MHEAGDEKIAHRHSGTLARERDRGGREGECGYSLPDVRACPATLLACAPVCTRTPARWQRFGAKVARVVVVRPARAVCCIRVCFFFSPLWRRVQPGRRTECAVVEIYTGPRRQRARVCRHRFGMRTSSIGNRAAEAKDDVVRTEYGRVGEDVKPCLGRCVTRMRERMKRKC